MKYGMLLDYKATLYRVSSVRKIMCFLNYCVLVVATRHFREPWKGL